MLDDVDSTPTASSTAVPLGDIAGGDSVTTEKPLTEACRPLLSWAESCCQHYGMMRQEPPFTTTRALKDAIAGVHAALRAAEAPVAAGLRAAAERYVAAYDTDTGAGFAEIDALRAALAAEAPPSVEGLRRDPNLALAPTDRYDGECDCKPLTMHAISCPAALRPSDTRDDTHRTCPSRDEFRRMTAAEVNDFFASAGSDWRVADPHTHDDGAKGLDVSAPTELCCGQRFTVRGLVIHRGIKHPPSLSAPKVPVGWNESGHEPYCPAAFMRPEGPCACLARPSDPA